ncbi:MAG: DUF1329 domain-containing protein [Deltaproteobacteria bacterium]|nr:DUF1329 domain-containing protein [Deltaproteobacteria bacterium]
MTNLGAPKTWLPLAALLPALLLARPVGAGAPPRPEAKTAGILMLTKENADAYKNLLPEPVYRRLKVGEYHFRVVPVDGPAFRRNYSERFWRASAANAGKYDIDAATGGLKEKGGSRRPAVLFGLPFPAIEPADPLAGPKILHNYRLRQLQGDGAVHYFSLVDVTRDGEVLRSVQIFLSHKFYVGTTSAPAAALPDNTESRQLAAAVAPKDVEGVGVLTWRFNDWSTWDHVWAFLPSIRRVRRVRTATRGERIPGFEVHGDDADCYDGKVEYFDWKLAGSGEVIGPLGSDSPYARELTPAEGQRWTMKLPYNRAVYEVVGAAGAAWLALDNVFVRRPVWIVEGTPRDPYYDLGRVVLYIDRELYHAYYKIGYSKAGDQFQTNFCGTAWGRTADGQFAAPTPLLVTGVNERENRGTPTGRYTRETFVRDFADSWFTPEHLTKLSE